MKIYLKINIKVLKKMKKIYEIRSFNIKGNEIEKKGGGEIQKSP